MTTTSYSELAMEGRRQLQSFQLPLPSLVGHPACPPWRGVEEVPAFPHPSLRHLVDDVEDRGSFASIAALFSRLCYLYKYTNSHLMF